MAAAGNRLPRAASPEAQLKRSAAIALILAGVTARADPDPWFGEDKAAHFAVSGGLAIAGYAAAATFAESPRVRVAYGASVALLAGIGKELWDASGPGAGSLKDLTWNVLGTAVGVAICWVIDRLLFKPAVHPERSRGTRASRPL